jgi:hypothetical protein
MINDPLDDMIRTRLEELDTVHPPHLPAPDALWQSLMARRASRKTQRRKAMWSIAASVLILFMAGYYFVSQRQHTSTLVTDRSQELRTPAKEQDALAYIARYCAGKNIACNAPAVLQLRSDLEHAADKLEEIDQQLRLYGNDADLIRARARVEKHQARVIKAIVQIL